MSYLPDCLLTLQNKNIHIHVHYASNVCVPLIQSCLNRIVSKSTKIGDTNLYFYDITKSCDQHSTYGKVAPVCWIEASELEEQVHVYD